jgi:hypothetical protein
MLSRLESDAAAIGLRAIQAPVRDVVAIEGVIRPAAGDALIVLNEIFTVTHRTPIVALASWYRLPAVYPVRAVPSTAA